MATLPQRLKNHFVSSVMGASRGLSTSFFNETDTPNATKPQADYNVENVNLIELAAYKRSYDFSNSIGKTLGIAPLAISFGSLMERDFITSSAILAMYLTTTLALRYKNWNSTTSSVQGGTA